MKEATLNLGLIGAFSVLVLTAFRFVGSNSIAVASLFVVAIVGYPILAIFALSRLWRVVRQRVNATWLRIPLQSAVAALLFSPTFAACGAVAPMPFSFILASDLVFPGPACGAVKSFAPFNALYVVLPTWVVITGAYALQQHLTQRHAL